MAKDSTKAPKKPKHRSPNYPAVGLKKAVELLGQMYEKYGTHPVPIKLLYPLWNYKVGSGIGNQCVAALKAYGLVSVEGQAMDRKVTVTPEGKRIVGNAPDRADLLKRAALAPKIHQEVLDHYGDRGLPDDDLLQQYLVWEREEGQRFNPETVSEFIGRFRETLGFSGAGESAKIDRQDEGDEEDSGDGQEVPPPPPETRLRRKNTMNTGFKEDVFSLDEGQVVLQWPERLSKTSADDLGDWLKLIGRKIQRAANAANDDPSDEADDEDNGE